jgi:hypothetical protein
MIRKNHICLILAKLSFYFFGDLESGATLFPRAGNPGYTDPCFKPAAFATTLAAVFARPSIMLRT